MIAQDLEAERAVLGAALVEPAVLPAAASVLSPADFSRPAHRAIFAALLSAEAGGQVDLVTVKSQLADGEQLEAAGGAVYLGGLVDGLPRFGEAAVLAWARRVRERARVRGIAAQLDRLRARAEEPEATADELGAALSDVALERDVVGVGVLDRTEVARRTWALIDEEITGRGTGLTTGLPALNRRLRFGGWRPGQLVYVGARTSRGKSALLLGMAESAAAAGRRVLMFSLEMTPEELGVRRLVAEAGVGVGAVFAWKPEERGRALERLGAVSQILERPLDFAHPAIRTLAGIRAECRRAKRRGLDVVVVDYLGLVRDQGRREASIYERTSQVSQGLKALAMELEVPVLCAVQLNREPAGGGRPSLAHFRDSGAVEQDCDVALLIHQGESTDAIRMGWVDLILAKQRNGWTGDVRLWWNATCARFEDRSAPQEAGNA